MVTKQTLHLRGYSSSETDAVVEVEPLAPGSRVGRAIGGFFAWFGAAIVTAFIPVAHFLLVPICVLAAFVALIVRLGTEVRIHAAVGKCPDCGAEQQLDLHGSWRLPKDVTCRNCHRRLTLHA